MKNLKRPYKGVHDTTAQQLIKAKYNPRRPSVPFLSSRVGAGQSEVSESGPRRAENKRAHELGFTPWCQDVSQDDRCDGAPR